VRGDTLTSIAKKFNTTVANLVKLNDIANPDLIIAGRTLKVPA
jgi:LysM repeat protein